MVRIRLSLLRNISTDCATMLCDADRYTGMPPIHLNKKPYGHRNSVCFPSQQALTRKAKATLNRTGESQLEVCGAAITTSLSMSGNRPSNRHPKIFRKEKARPRIRGLIKGVSKSV